MKMLFKKEIKGNSEMDLLFLSDSNQLLFVCLLWATSTDLALSRTLPEVLYNIS